MKKSSKRVVIAASILLVLALSAAGAYLRINGQKAAEDAATSGGLELPDVSAADQFATNIALPVEVAEVVLDTLVLTVQAAGEAVSRQQTAVRAQVAGAVRRVHVAENQSVGAGAVLIELDRTEYELGLQEALAQQRTAEMSYRELTLGDDREPDPRVRAERDSAARARSGIDGAGFAVARAEMELARTRITAPFGGRIANLSVVPGQYIGAGDELLTVIAMDPVRVQANVSQGEIGFVAPGRQADITFTAFPGEIFAGRIESINPVVDAETRMARVSILVPNPGGRILPGMYARARLPARRFADRVIIPREALLERDNRNMLFVFEGDAAEGRAMWRYVNPGLMNDTHVEILEDGPEDGMVYPGELVLVGGHYTLNHDAIVRAVQNATQVEGGRVR